MQAFTTKTELTNYLNTTAKGETVGFVPTMGALHKGHLSLIEESNYTCDITICSIFINPTQFNNSKDLAKYPKTLEKDLSLLTKTNCDIVYSPQVTDLYISGEESVNYNFGDIAILMEGKHRPGHFPVDAALHTICSDGVNRHESHHHFLSEENWNEKV